MCKVISLLNNKGGVGKTTSTGFISQIMACLNQKVLVIDLDQQSNLSMLLGQHEEDSPEVISGIESPEYQNISDLFRYRYRDSENVSHLVRHTRIHNLDIIPSSKRHKNTQMVIASNETGNNNIILKKALFTIKDQYDFILIDNAPANDILTVNSLFASDMAVVPVRLEGFSYKGLRETIDTIYYIKSEHDIDTIEFSGAFITQAETNTVIYKSLSENYKNELCGKFYRSCIRKDIRVSEIETAFAPVMEYCPDSRVVYDYSILLLEMHILPPAAQALLSSTLGTAV